jgi:hypothetical protein
MNTKEVNNISFILEPYNNKLPIKVVTKPIANLILVYSKAIPPILIIKPTTTI